MKTNNELIEEFRAMRELHEVDKTGDRISQECFWLLTILTQKDDEVAERYNKLADAAEMLWVVLANVSESHWEKQTPEWQEAAIKWRDNYFATLTPHPTEDTSDKSN